MSASFRLHPVGLIVVLSAVVRGSSSIAGEFDPPTAEFITESQSRTVVFRSVSDKNQTGPESSLIFCDSFIDGKITDPSVAVIHVFSREVIGTSCLVNFTVQGKNLGYASAILVSTADDGNVIESPSLRISVVRPSRLIDAIFALSVVVLVSISYVNMGATLEWPVVKATMRRPLGPIVGLCCQYLFMPLVGYGLTRGLMEDSAMRLSLFVVACCPGGGASNFWTILLRGNLNLSVTMTFVSSIAAFATMPAWIFTIGGTIFNDAEIKIPYGTIAFLTAGLVVPCGIGLGLQKWAPNVARILSSKFLRPVALLFIVYLLTVGTYANLYVVRLVTLRIVVASMILTWSGFAFGAIIAKLFKFTSEDIVAIAIETGVQNAGVAIVMLHLSLPKPASDLALVVPAIVSAMVPPPLAVAWLLMAIRRRKKAQLLHTEVETPAVKSADDQCRSLPPSETRTSLLETAEQAAIEQPST